MQIAVAGLVLIAAMPGAGTVAAERSRGLSLEQLRGVMRVNAGQTTSARPYQPSPVRAFDRCTTGVLDRARFPGGPASVEAPLVFEPS